MTDPHSQASSPSEAQSTPEALELCGSLPRRAAWYANKRVVITGGSSGIGLATAAAAVRAGATVAIVARNPKRLEIARARLAKLAPTRPDAVHAFAVDVSDEQAVGRLAKDVLAKLSGLDLLINNAGVAHPGHIHQVPAQVYRQMVEINYLGVVYMTQAFLPHFIAQKSGNIANVSSVLGQMGVYGYAAYAGSKYAVAGFSDCLRQDLLPYNVGVSVLFPADTNTPQLHAENEIKPQETKALAGTIKVSPAHKVAADFLDGIAAGRYEIIPGAMSRLTLALNRHLPGLVRAVIGRDLRRFWRRHGAPVVDAPIWQQEGSVAEHSSAVHAD